MLSTEATTSSDGVRSCGELLCRLAALSSLLPLVCSQMAGKLLSSSVGGQVKHVSRALRVCMRHL